MMDWGKIKYFKLSEFACKCGCGQNNISEQLVMAIDMARRDAGVPFTVASGCRCAKHNKMVGGVDDSSHVLGFAVDIQVRNSADRLKVVKALLRYFDRIGIAKNFIHIDIDHNKPSPVMWVY